MRIHFSFKLIPKLYEGECSCGIIDSTLPVHTLYAIEWHPPPLPFPLQLADDKSFLPFIKILPC